MLATLWLRPLWQRPRRALATVLGVALGVASVLATGLASRAAVASMTDDVEALGGPARLEVTRPGGVPLADMGRLAALAGRVRIAPIVEGTALVPARGELVRLFGLDALELAGTLAARMGERGTETDTEDQAEVGARLVREPCLVLSREAAADLGVAPGDGLELVVRSRRVALSVAGTFEPGRAREAWRRVLVLDVALAQELLGELERVDRLELVPRRALDEHELDALAAEARALLPVDARVGPPALRRAEGERFVRSLTFNLTALAGVSVLVAIVLVATTLATSVVQRRAAIALLRSLGASRAQLGCAVLLETAAIGLAGGVLGVALGTLGARRIAADVHGSFATLSEDVLLGAVRLEPGWAVAGVLLGLASALAASFLPLQEAWSTPPVQHLRASGAEAAPLGRARRVALFVALLLGAWFTALLPAWDGRPISALVSALLLLSALIVLSGPLVDALAHLPVAWLGRGLATPLRLAQAALAAARRRAAWAASAVGVSVALAIGMTTMIESFRANVLDWTSQAMGSDLYLRPLASADGTTAGRLAPEVVALAVELFGRDAVDPYHESVVTLVGLEEGRGAGATIALGGSELAVVARVGGVPFLDGRNSRAVFAEALARGTVLVNEPFARRFDLWRGARVRLSTAAGTLEREIAGVYRDFSGHTGRVVLDLADYRRLVGTDGPDSVGVHLPEGADVAAERARLTAALAGRFELEVLDNRAVRAEVLRVFERTFAVTRALQALSALVAALAVVLVLGALVRERERELAVVRVLGGSLAQLAGLVSAQALLLGLAGALGGLAIGLVIGYLLVTVVNVQSFGWSLRFTLPASVLASAALVVPACLAAGALPAWLSLRLQPQAALREPD
jgi:putative ABC transport system permease protein